MSNHALDALHTARDAAADSLKEAEALARELRQKIKDFDLAIQTLSGDQLDAGEAGAGQPSPRSADSKSMKSMIVDFVNDAPKTVTAQEVLDHLVHLKGRDTTMNSVLSTLSRVTREGLIASPNRGVWCSVQKKIGPAEAGPNDSGDGDGSQGRASHPSPAGSTPVVSTAFHRTFDDPFRDDTIKGALPTIDPPWWKKGG
jgi:hypothetical protein